MEKLNTKIDNNINIKEYAKKIVDLPLEAQKTEIGNLFTQLTVQGLELTIEVIRMLNQSNEEIIKLDKYFIELCNNTIDTLKIFISDGNITKEEKDKAFDVIMKIMNMTNESHNKTIEAVKEENKNAVKFAAGAGAVAFLGTFAIICKAIVKK